MIQLMRTEIGQTEHITHDALVNSAYKISERGRTQTAKIRRGENYIAIRRYWPTALQSFPLFTLTMAERQDPEDVQPPPAPD